MLTRDFDLKVIDQVLARLKKRGLQDDRRFAEVCARVWFERGCGPERLFRELRKNGIAEEMIDACLKESAENCDWDEQLQAVRAKKFGEPLPQEFKEQARQARFLQSRGFTTEQIRSAFNWD